MQRLVKVAASFSRISKASRASLESCRICFSMLGILRGIAQEFGTSSLQWLFPLALGILSWRANEFWEKPTKHISFECVVFLPYILPLNPPVPHISFFPATKAQNQSRECCSWKWYNMICEKVVCVCVLQWSVKMCVCDTGVCYNVVCDNVACVCGCDSVVCVCVTLLCAALYEWHRHMQQRCIACVCGNVVRACLWQCCVCDTVQWIWLV